MLKNLNKLDLVFSLAAILSFGIYANALDDLKFRVPLDGSGIPRESVSLFGADRTVISNQTVAVVISSQAGVLLGAEVSTGTVATFAYCADYDRSNLTLANSLIGGSSATLKLFNPLYSDVVSTNTLSLEGRGFTPTEFTSGLTCIMSAAGVELQVRYILNGRD